MRGFYEVRIAPFISDLSAVVISIGIISVSIGYVNAILTAPDILFTSAFWIRFIALAATVTFTCFFLISYVADLDGAHDTSWASESRSPSRIIALYLIDLLMLGLQGCMYGVIVLRDFSEFGELGPSEALEMGELHFVFLAGLAAAWHLTTASWHLLARSLISAHTTHLIFCALFTALMVVACFFDLDSPAKQFAWAGTFFTIVMALFFIRGRKLIKNALCVHC